MDDRDGRRSLENLPLIPWRRSHQILFAVLTLTVVANFILMLLILITHTLGA